MDGIKAEPKLNTLLDSMEVCAMCKYLITATPHTLACHLTSLSHLFFHNL